ncbi:MAG: hypothetical protein AB1646_00535 [Thermodesulfobacteriota bacterium]
MDLQLSTVIIVAAVVLIIGFGATRLFGKGEGKSLTGRSTHEHKRCACGWQGMVSRFVKKCPNCGSPV